MATVDSALRSATAAGDPTQRNSGRALPTSEYRALMAFSALSRSAGSHDSACAIHSHPLEPHTGYPSHVTVQEARPR
ncbi:hypothetical protein Aglo03_03740 [Actinokineospora globicatena]|uniref:Uncharacterized protein n=1 Tax=Actinokineospora globicatena TaxID=103729 RepID=A0A9W6QFM0_9PSEU|nr:hypothetical protein Aglo03_03740 [Actinokineospora globicatena]